MSEQDKLELSREQAAHYLAAFDPTLQLGARIGTGCAASVYKLAGTDPEQVVKIIDTRVYANNDTATAIAKQIRLKIKEYQENEIKHMLLLQSCEQIMPITSYHILRAPEPGTTDPSIAVFLIVMPEMTPLLEYNKTHDLTEDDLVQLALDIGSALQACAQEEILHRDVKQGNIFVVRRQDKLRFVLGDFGISRRLEELGGEPITQIGTNNYKAPEILYGKSIRYRNSDLFSLGVVLYALLTNVYPYNNVGYTTGRNRIPPIPEISREFFDIIEKMLQLDPEFRYHHPDDLLADLKALIPTRRKRVVKMQYEKSAREHMMHGRYSKAIADAGEGIRRGEPACSRILAYCLFRQAPCDPKMREKVLRLLDDLCLEEDQPSIFLRGMISGMYRQWEDYIDDLRTAAESGFVPACYYYGRALFYGDCPACPRNETEGLIYIQKAAERQFYPALRIIKRLLRKDPTLTLPEDLKKLLDLEYSKDDPREKQDYIRYL